MQTREVVVARVRKKIRLLHLAMSTEDSVCAWTARYYPYCIQLPATWTPEQKAEEYHLLVDSPQRVVYTAAQKLELEGVVTPHCLRHAYATHSREQVDAG